MYKVEHFITTTANKETIWDIWSKVDDWHQWDNEVKNSSLDGPFATGSKGLVVLPNGKQVDFTITDCQPLKGFSTHTRLLLCSMNFFRELIEVDTGIKIVHRVEFSGLLSFMFYHFIGKKMDKDMPFALENLVKRAEQHS